jgi:5-methylcytosine-specific restriction endonuclease McrA
MNAIEHKKILARERNRRYAERHPDRVKVSRAAATAKYREKNKDTEQYREKAAARMKAWYAENKERALETAKAYRQIHADKLRKADAEKYRRNSAAYKRRAREREKLLQKRALGSTFDKQILAIYAEAERITAETKIPHEVDHIIPLNGRTVSGLHVPWNLRVIPRHINRQKSNRLEVSDG